MTQRRPGMAVTCVLLVAACVSIGATTRRGPAHRAVHHAPPPHGVADSTGAVIYGEPQLYMAWHAPWGELNATDTLSVPSVADSSRTDTLYLSFDSGRDAPKFYGMFARLYFRPQFGDTLGRFFNFKRGWWNMGNLRIEFDPSESFPCPQPWPRTGFGQPDFEWEDGGHAARLDLIYAMPQEQTAPIKANTRYCFARLMFRERRPDLLGSHDPVCLEWSTARLSFGGADVIATHGPGRFVSFNSPDGSVCTPYRRETATSSWHPKNNVNPEQAPPHIPKP